LNIAKKSISFFVVVLRVLISILAGRLTIPTYFVIFLGSIQIVGYSLKLGCDSFIPCVLECTIHKIFNHSILQTASVDFRGLYLNTQVSDRYGMGFKPRPIYVGFVIEKVALEYNVLFALHFSRKSINLPNASYSFVPQLPALFYISNCQRR
jgi:hypothetical protein